MGKGACAGETLADLGSTLWAKAVITSSFETEKWKLFGSYWDVLNVSFRAPPLLSLIVVVDHYPRHVFW